MRSRWWLIASLLLLLFIGEACGRRPEQQIVIIPQPPICSVNVVQGDSLVPLGTLDFPRYTFTPRDTRRVDARTQYVNGLARAYDGIVTSESGWIASIVENGKAIGVARVDEAGSLVLHPDLAVPSGFRIHALALMDDVLFVGGQGENEMAGCLDLADDVPSWKNVPVPDSIKRDGKSIDGFLVSGERLISIDDTFHPKWLLLYDIRDPVAPVLTKMERLPDHGPYEWIVKSVINGRWIAVLSGTSGELAYCQHIAVLDTQIFSEVAVLDHCSFQSRWAGYPALSEDTVLKWNSIALCGSWLLIAAGNRGVGTIEIDKALQSIDKQGTVTLVPKYRIPDFLSGADVLNILLKGPTNAVTIVYSRDGKLETCETLIAELREDSD